ncbi:hypothetical protein ACQCSU_21610 (plasmid) [Pseudarthrobacter sp. O4]|uniref:hypothetical protein n=1 Tax=Pseudarthrobacter sp. O4 TaxID=3418417 RepID=UPI003CF4C9B5
MNKITKALLGLVAVAGLTLTVAPGANATVLHTDVNYTGGVYGADNAPYTLGWIDDQATSVRNYGYNVRFFEYDYKLGLHFTSSADFNDLRSVGQKPGYNWDDDISSYQRW